MHLNIRICLAIKYLHCKLLSSWVQGRVGEATLTYNEEVVHHNYGGKIAAMISHGGSYFLETNWPTLWRCLLEQEAVVNASLLSYNVAMETCTQMTS